METNVIALEGSVRASQIAKLYATTQEAIENQQPITFDFQKTTDIDGSVLQLLIATHRNVGDRFSITGVTPKLATTLARYGVGELPMWQQQRVTEKEAQPHE